MAKNPSRKLSESKVFVLIIMHNPPSDDSNTLQRMRSMMARGLRGMRIFVLLIFLVIRIHFSEWEVCQCCCPRTTTPARGVRIYVLIIPQVIRTHFSDSEWEVVVCPRRGLRIFFLIIPPSNPNTLQRMGSSSILSQVMSKDTYLFKC
jgi:hypothetical protein